MTGSGIGLLSQLILCISLHTIRSGTPVLQVFACTVGQKPSKAPFYMNDTADVASLLARLSEMHQHRSPARLKPSGKGMRRV